MKKKIAIIIGILGVLVLFFLFRNNQAEAISLKEVMEQEFPEEETYEKMVVTVFNFSGEKPTGIERVEIDDKALVADIIESAGSMSLTETDELPSADYQIEMYFNDNEYRSIMVGERTNTIDFEGMLFEIESDNLLLEALREKGNIDN